MRSDMMQRFGYYSKCEQIKSVKILCCLDAGVLLRAHEGTRTPTPYGIRS